MPWDQNPAGFHCRTQTRSAHVWPFDTRRNTMLPPDDALPPDNMPIVWRWSVFTRKQPGETWEAVQNVGYGESVMIADAFAAAERKIRQSR